MPFDAMDLGAMFVFAISGAARGVHRRVDLFRTLAVAWGALVAADVGRALLALQAPSVLRSELYAVAALAGAGSISLGCWAGHSTLPTAASGRPYACLCA